MKTPFEVLCEKESEEGASYLLDAIDDREKKIIFQRFGLDGGKPKTLEEVGKKFGVTRERIRQLQNIALAKLRHAMARYGDPNLPSWEQKVAQEKKQRREAAISGI